MGFVTVELLLGIKVCFLYDSAVVPSLLSYLPRDLQCFPHLDSFQLHLFLSYPKKALKMAETHGPEKAINGNYPNHLSKDYGNEEALNRIRTAESISISPELFEKIYLSPQNNVKGTLCLA